MSCQPSAYSSFLPSYSTTGFNKQLCCWDALATKIQPWKTPSAKHGRFYALWYDLAGNWTLNLFLPPGHWADLMEGEEMTSSQYHKTLIAWLLNRDGSSSPTIRCGSTDTVASIQVSLHISDYSNLKKILCVSQRATIRDWGGNMIMFGVTVKSRAVSRTESFWDERLLSWRGWTEDAHLLECLPKLWTWNDFDIGRLHRSKNLQSATCWHLYKCSNDLEGPFLGEWRLRANRVRLAEVYTSNVRNGMTAHAKNTCTKKSQE